MGRKKNENRISLDFIGLNAHEVTGSCTLLEVGTKKKYLIECGLRQSSNKIDDIKANSQKFPFKTKDINGVFIFHSHIDHIGRLGLLTKRNYNNPIYVPKGNKDIIEALLLDSQKIMQQDVKILGKTDKSIAEGLYSIEDVRKVIDLIVELDFNTKYEIDENLTIELIHNSHIVGASSGVLWVKANNSTVKKILYTSDIGNIQMENCNPYINKFEVIDKCNYIISEATYSDNDRSRQSKRSDRDKDIEKIQSAIQTVCCDNKGRILMPVFSYGRCQTMMTILYELYNDDNDFNIPIYIDGKLIHKINKAFNEILEGEKLELWKKVYNWKYFKYISDTEDSKYAVNDNNPCICLGSGGFLMGGGRAIPWAKSILPNKKDMIIFCGYGGSEDSIIYRIKHSELHKVITIDKKKCKNNCAVMSLKSFSSHIQHDDLLDLLGNKINVDNKIFLVHGNMDSKIEFSHELKKLLQKNNKTTGVVVVNKGTKSNL